ncbi:hypothetical protein ALI144C_20620 [Actinosynnema sp. ALI-1.44]|uniref:hypothetical protein n=1 Tax=Actinosynnema sp. ALI-1.44 TaxID=1933779 RepID=UPI00097C02B5|nr:hypothetical protein [Actinosynnema sp. ALI-1.44]ONI80977.1 hypothetical protein ALI144C_20620 [Actinosynnema sp. ALI-1.44]
MNTEELIKQAFTRQAESAGDHREVLTEVYKATARRRIGGWTIGLISAGVAAVVVAPIVLFSGGRPDGAAPADSTATTLPLPPAPKDSAKHAGEDVIMLRYQPSWLPEGAYESGRSFAGRGSLARTWNLPGGGEGRHKSVTLSLVNQAPLPAEGKTVDINGVTGKVVTDHLTTFVAWMPTPGERLSVSILGTGDVTETVLRIARSVNHDGNAEYEWPLAFDWLPNQAQPSGFNISGSSPNDVDVSVSADFTTQPHGQDAIWADIGPLPEPPEGESVTVRGKQGFFIPGESSGEIDVELEPNRWLRVSGPLSREDLVKVVDSIKIGPLHYPWLGTR